MNESNEAMNDNAETPIAAAVKEVVTRPPESTADKLNALVAATTHPEFQTREITCNGVTREFTFRRLPYAEVDLLRLRSTGADGQFDPMKYAGNNGRWVAAALVDDQTHLPLVSEMEVVRWDTVLVDALANAATDVNAVNKNSPEAIKGN